MEEFKPFVVTVPETCRYWEDESTGVLIKRGQDATIGARQFRSTELRQGLFRNRVLIKSGEAKFVYKNSMITISEGTDGKNKITETDLFPSEELKNESKKTEVKIEEPKIEIEKKIEQPIHKDVRKVFHKKEAKPLIPEFDEMEN